MTGVTAGEQAENFYDCLEEVIRAEVPIKLVDIGTVSGMDDLFTMWENAADSL